MSETTVIDRNAQFDAERAGQLAAIMAYNASIPARVEAAKAAAESLRADTEARVARGELIALGGDRYRVTQGYDRNEIWTLRTLPGVSTQPLLLPESNLDTSTGKAALYTTTPEWHTLGNVVPEGITDLDEVLEAGGIAWLVDQSPAQFTAPDGKLIEVPGAFVNYRTDTLAPLGVVGRVYNPFQNRVAGAFLQDLVVKYDIKFESAGATYGGKHVFIGMRLPEDVTLDLGNGVTDIIIPFLYFLNSHDGTTSASVTVSPWRVRCGNTERFNLRDAVARWSTRHTTNALDDDRLEEARRTLNLSVKYFGDFKDEEEQLARINLQLAEFEALAADIYGAKPGAEATDTKKRNWDDRMGTLTGMWKGQAEETGKTAYSAERVFTDFIDHVAPKRVAGDKMAAARATALIEGTDDKVKNNVHARLLTLTTR